MIFFSLIIESFKSERFPLSINNQIIGYIDLYTDELRDKDGNIRKNSMKKNFLDYFLRHWRDKIINIQKRKMIYQHLI